MAVQRPLALQTFLALQSLLPRVTVVPRVVDFTTLGLGSGFSDTFRGMVYVQILRGFLLTTIMRYHASYILITPAKTATELYARVIRCGVAFCVQFQTFFPRFCSVFQSSNNLTYDGNMLYSASAHFPQYSARYRDFRCSGGKRKQGKNREKHGLA